MAPGGQSGGLTKADMGKAKMRAQRIVYMPIERERKFLVLGDTWRSSVTETVSIRQGYVTSSAMNSVRVRATSQKGFLTIKSGSDPLRRLECEYAILIADAIILLDVVCEKPILEKSRHRIPTTEGLVWEVDEFHGHLSGLVLAEIELPDHIQEVDLPSWVEQEVTQDPRYLNANLVKAMPPIGRN